jgi:hypothetical protein
MTEQGHESEKAAARIATYALFKLNRDAMRYALRLGHL